MFRSTLTKPSMRLRLHSPSIRPFSLSTPSRVAQYPNDLSTNSKTKTDLYDSDKPHAVQDKVRQGDTYNVHESSAKAGMDAHKEGKGGHATERRDSAGGKEKAKKEFPEAPDPAIGMQDERGGRGG